MSRPAVKRILSALAGPIRFVCVNGHPVKPDTHSWVHDSHIEDCIGRYTLGLMQTIEPEFAETANPDDLDRLLAFEAYDDE